MALFKGLVSIHCFFELSLWFCPAAFQKVTPKLVTTFDKWWVMPVSMDGYQKMWLSMKFSSVNSLWCDILCPVFQMVLFGVWEESQYLLAASDSLFFLNLVSWSRTDFAQQFWAVFLLQMKASSLCLGPRVLWNWTLLHTPGVMGKPSPPDLLAEGHTRHTHLRAKVSFSFLPPGPKIPLESLWSLPSGIMQTAGGNPKIVFSPDKHSGQRKDLCMPSWWTEFYLSLEKVAKNKNAIQHLFSTLRNCFQRINSKA